MQQQKVLQRRGSFPFWKFNIFAWVFIGVFAFFIRLFLHEDALRALGFVCAQETFGFLACACIYKIYKKHRVGDPFRLATAAAIIVLSFAASILQATVAYAFTELTGWQYSGWTVRESWFFRITFFWLLYMAWNLGYFALEAKWTERSATAKAEAALAEKMKVELQLLRSQLDPHFLFNSLNSIAAEIEPHPDRAIEILEELSSYLRFSLDHRDAVFTSLHGELEAVLAYVAIEKVRFGKRVMVEVSIRPEINTRNIPAFLLQPLVENAVKHGLHKITKDWMLRISAQPIGEHGGGILLKVENTGTLDPDASRKNGVGLSTLLRRLELHYPGNHSFRLFQDCDAVCAQLEIFGEPCCG